MPRTAVDEKNCVANLNQRPGPECWLEGWCCQVVLEECGLQAVRHCQPSAIQIWLVTELRSPVHDATRITTETVTVLLHKLSYTMYMECTAVTECYVKTYKTYKIEWFINNNSLPVNGHEDSVVWMSLDLAVVVRSNPFLNDATCEHEQRRDHGLRGHYK